VAIVENYDRKSFFKYMFLRYHHFHPLSINEKKIRDKNEKDYNLDIFEMVANPM
jgi:hypothetical protein